MKFVCWGGVIFAVLGQMLRDRGVTFYEASNVEMLEGSDKVQSVRIRNYKKNEVINVPADLVLVAIGQSHSFLFLSMLWWRDLRNFSTVFLCLYCRNGSQHQMPAEFGYRVRRGRFHQCRPGKAPLAVVNSIAVTFDEQWPKRWAGLLS